MFTSPSNSRLVFGRTIEWAIPGEPLGSRGELSVRLRLESASSASRFVSVWGYEFSLGDDLIARRLLELSLEVGANGREAELVLPLNQLEAFVFARWEDGYALTVASRGRLPYVLIRGLREREKDQLKQRLEHFFTRRGMGRVCAHLREAPPLELGSANWPLGRKRGPTAPTLHHDAPSSPTPEPRTRPTQASRVPGHVRCDNDGSTSPFRGSEPSKLTISVREAGTKRIGPCLLVRLLTGRKLRWRRVTRRVRIDETSIRVSRMHEEFADESAEGEPVGVRVFTTLSYKMGEISSLWFDENVLCASVGEFRVELLGGFTDAQRERLSAELMRFLHGSGKMRLH